MPDTYPSYRLHKPSGQAVVTLGGKDFYPRKHDSPESRAEYDRVIATWPAAGRCLPQGKDGTPDSTVDQLVASGGSSWHTARLWSRRRRLRQDVPTRQGRSSLRDWP